MKTKNPQVFFTQLYPEFGEFGYNKVRKIFLSCYKKGTFKGYPKKEVKKFFITIANCTYFAYAVVNYKTVKRPEPDPTLNPVATELEKYFKEFRTDRILLRYKHLYWALLKDYFKVDLNGDTEPYTGFLYPEPTSCVPSSSFDTKNRVHVTPGGRTNRYNKHIFH